MPRLWDRSRQKVRTPFADLLTEYVRAHWPMTLKQLAVQVGLAPTTVQRYVNDGAVPRDPRILERISEATGIPLARLYNAAGIHIPTIVTPPVDTPEPRRRPPSPPRRRDAGEPQQAPRIAEQAPRYAALDEWVRHTHALGLPPEVEQALISTTVESVTGYTPEQLHWQQRYREEHDQDAIGTLELPAIPAGQQQPEHRPAAETNTQHTSEPLLHK